MEHQTRKLKAEEQEALFDLLDHPGMPALMAQADRCAAAQEADVLRFSVSPENEKECLYAKIRSEGARKLVRDFQSLLEKLKKAQIE